MSSNAKKHLSLNKKGGGKGKEEVVVSITNSKPGTSSSSQPKSRRRRRRRNRRGTNVRGGSSAQLWLKSLNDPFLYQGVRFGYNTLAPTGLYTIYSRNSFTVSAGNSCAVILDPNVIQCTTTVPGVTPANASMLMASTAGTGTWTGYNLGNQASFAGVVNRSRTVSAGLRLVPNVGLTTAPGYCYAGQLTGMYWNNATGPTNQFLFNSTTLTSNGPLASTLISYPSLRLGSMMDGCCALARPIDQTAEEFVGAYGTSGGIAAEPDITPPSWGFPVIVFSNTSSSAQTFMVEVVVNFEALNQLGSGYTGDELGNNTENSAGEPSVLDEYPSFTAAWRAIRSLVYDAGIPSATLAGVEEYNRSGNLPSSVMKGASSYWSYHGADDRARRITGQGFRLKDEL